MNVKGQVRYFELKVKGIEAIWRLVGCTCLKWTVRKKKKKNVTVYLLHKEGKKCSLFELKLTGYSLECMLADPAESGPIPTLTKRHYHN